MNLVRFSLICVILLTCSACAVTERGPLKNEAMGCKFIGISCSKLQAGKDDQATLRYIAEDAAWTSYNKIMVDPITFWGTEGNEASGTDQQMLIDFLQQKIVEAASKYYEVVTKPGPGVMRIDVALSDATSATPMLRSISVLYPQAHMLSNIAYAATGKFPFSGGIEGVSKLSDSMTGKVLAGFIDKQVGGGALSTGFQWKWGDAENALALWVTRTSDVLHGWTSGKTKP